MIYLKNIDSKIFDEAYFIMKDPSLYEKGSECDMVKEANRILSENLLFERDRPLTKIIKFVKKNAIQFIAGGCVGTVLTLLIVL